MGIQSREREIKKKNNFWLDLVQLSHATGLVALTSLSHFDQVDHARSEVFDSHLHDNRFLRQSLVPEQTSPGSQSGRL